MQVGVVLVHLSARPVLAQSARACGECTATFSKGVLVALGPAFQIRAIEPPVLVPALVLQLDQALAVQGHSPADAPVAVLGDGLSSPGFQGLTHYVARLVHQAPARPTCLPSRGDPGHLKLGCRGALLRGFFVLIHFKWSRSDSTIFFLFPFLFFCFLFFFLFFFVFSFSFYSFYFFLSTLYFIFLSFFFFFFFFLFILFFIFLFYFFLFLLLFSFSFFYFLSFFILSFFFFIFFYFLFFLFSYFLFFLFYYFFFSFFFCSSFFYFLFYIFFLIFCIYA